MFFGSALLAKEAQLLWLSCALLICAACLALVRHFLNVNIFVVSVFSFNINIFQYVFVQHFMKRFSKVVNFVVFRTGSDEIAEKLRSCEFGMFRHHSTKSGVCISSRNKCIWLVFFYFENNPFGKQTPSCFDRIPHAEPV